MEGEAGEEEVMVELMVDPLVMAAENSWLLSNSLKNIEKGKNEVVMGFI